MIRPPLHRFFRICESVRPIPAKREGSHRVPWLRPNPAPPSDGVGCHQGLAFLAVHHDPAAGIVR